MRTTVYFAAQCNIGDRLCHSIANNAASLSRSIFRLVLAEPGVVAQDLTSHHVHGGSEGTPEEDVVGHQENIASRVDSPEAGVLVVGLLVESLVVRDLVGGVD